MRPVRINSYLYGATKIEVREVGHGKNVFRYIVLRGVDKSTTAETAGFNDYLTLLIKKAVYAARKS